MRGFLTEKAKISKAISVTAGAAGTSDVEGTILDMLGFDGVLFVVQMGAIVSGAVTTIEVEQGDASDLSDGADLEGSSQTIADDDDENVFYIDLRRVTKRYVRLKCDRATQNATLSAIAIQYEARSTPVTAGTGVSGEQHASPAEGTP